MNERGRESGKMDSEQAASSSHSGVLFIVHSLVFRDTMIISGTRSRGRSSSVSQQHSHVERFPSTGILLKKPALYEDEGSTQNTLNARKRFLSNKIVISFDFHIFHKTMFGVSWNDETMKVEFPICSSLEEHAHDFILKTHHLMMLRE
jgi:hypothetical protein